MSKAFFLHSDVCKTFRQVLSNVVSESDVLVKRTPTAQGFNCLRGVKVLLGLTKSQNTMKLASIRKTDRNLSRALLKFIRDFLLRPTYIPNTFTIILVNEYLAELRSI